jgi:hypothetical protein
MGYKVVNLLTQYLVLLKYFPSVVNTQADNLIPLALSLRYSQNFGWLRALGWRISICLAVSFHPLQYIWLGSFAYLDTPHQAMITSASFLKCYIFFYFGATAPTGALAYLHETFRFTSVYYILDIR